ncbi:MAG: hypothetical protein J0M00_18545 [Burkholderiales bacterium]|nr:hypothetical protein [Burkholderiales bacterium]
MNRPRDRARAVQPWLLRITRNRAPLPAVTIELLHDAQPGLVYKPTVVEQSTSVWITITIDQPINAPGVKCRPTMRGAVIEYVVKIRRNRLRVEQ